MPYYFFINICRKGELVIDVRHYSNKLFDATKFIPPTSTDKYGILIDISEIRKLERQDRAKLVRITDFDSQPIPGTRIK